MQPLAGKAAVSVPMSPHSNCCGSQHFCITAGEPAALYAALAPLFLILASQLIRVPFFRGRLPLFEFTSLIAHTVYSIPAQRPFPPQRWHFLFDIIISVPPKKIATIKVAIF